MALLNSPPLSEPMILEDGRLSIAWTQWFMQVFRGTSFYGSGTTANRPALKDLKAGGYFLDTTLGIPIFVNALASAWIDATGAPV